MLKIITILWIILNAVSMMWAGLLQSWTFELIELKSGTSDPDIVDLKFEIVRLGRGKYGFSGFMDIKVDMYDDILVSGSIERSKHRDGPYYKFPMGVDNELLSSAINQFYTNLLQPEAAKCCENAPIYNKKFVPPLEKRNITINNCVLSTDNFPNIIMEGYYRIRMTSSGPVVVFVETLSLVENKIF